MNASAHRPEPVERLLDVTVFAPLGLALAAREDLAGFADRGRTAVTNRIMLARFVGQMAITQGRRELERRIAARLRPAAPSPTATADEAAPDTSTTRTAGAPVTGTPVTGTADPASALPIADYESLPAINVVQRLATLRPEEIEAIRSFEASHRARRTILAKIAQLQGR